ncbi:MAG TPA: dihydroorotate dehydrogenase electron transfer subunit [Candidatus Baltobacteraceae bacterium]|nr:dihydroorotate dehydrogenase electron transfer subunit [Candidatus Baltobacteraceae bacterium]
MPAVDSKPVIHRTTVCDRREEAPGIVVLGLEAPGLARATRAGQFVMAVPPAGERAATALGVYEAEDERISLMLVVVGPRTRELANLPVGAALDLLGPLGNGFDLAALGSESALVAGGVGLASLLLPALQLTARGARVHLYYGARNAAALVDAERLKTLGLGVSLATDDGSRGFHGFVTELFAREARAHDAIAACGPSPMLRAVGRIAAERGVRAQLSLEETFACGVGACWGCVVPLDRASAQAPRFPPAPDERRDYVHARICKEGPVFWSDELRWRS